MTTFALLPNGKVFTFPSNDFVAKSSTGFPKIRTAINSKSNSLLELKGRLNYNFNVKSGFNLTDFQEITHDTYEIILDGESVLKNVKLEDGAIFTIVGNNVDEKPVLKTIQIVQSNTVNMLWLLPQYVVITTGEVMFSITGLEFAFTQAPVSMKSFLTSGWLLAVAVGNLIVVAVTEARFFDRQVIDNFFFFYHHSH